MEQKKIQDSPDQVDAGSSKSPEGEQDRTNTSDVIQGDSVSGPLDSNEGGASLTTPDQSQGVLQRFLNLFSRKEIPAVEEPVVVLDDQQVDQRMVGEKPPEPSTEPVIPRPRRKFRRREKPQPEPQVPTRSEVVPPPLISKEVEAPDYEKAQTVAMEDYVPQAGGEREVSVLERFRNWFNQLHTGQKVLLYSSIFVFIALCFFLFMVVLRLIPIKPEPAVVPPPVSNLDPTIPIPVEITLPDGQAYELALGGVVDGQWTPVGAEWLIDTEVPRWISLPWSRELESAVQSYNENEPIQLLMSNGDILVYRFQAVEEIPQEELMASHALTGDLMVWLYKPNSKTCLVLISTP